MEILIVLIVLCSGYIFASGHPYYKVMLHSYEGQHLYFLFAKLGILLFFTGSVFAYLLCFTSTPEILSGIPGINDFNLNKTMKIVLIQHGIVKNEDAQLLSWLIFSSLSALLLAFAYPFLITFRYRNMVYKALFYEEISSGAGPRNKRPKLFGMVASDKAGLLVARQISFGNHFYRELSMSKVVERLQLIMNDRSVYIGSASEFSLPTATQPVDHFKFIVSAMGYVDKDNFRVKLNYVVECGSEGIPHVLRYNDIKSINRIDEATYLAMLEGLVRSAR